MKPRVLVNEVPLPVTPPTVILPSPVIIMSLGSRHTTAGVIPDRPSPRVTVQVRVYEVSATGGSVEPAISTCTEGKNKGKFSINYIILMICRKFVPHINHIIPYVMKGMSLLVHIVWVQCHAVVTGGESRPDCDWGKSLLQHLCFQCQSVDVNYRRHACILLSAKYLACAVGLQSAKINFCEMLCKVNP